MPKLALKIRDPFVKQPALPDMAQAQQSGLKHRMIGHWRDRALEPLAANSKVRA